VIDHVSIQVADPAASRAFYDTVLAPLGGGTVMAFGPVTGFGRPDRPTFWIGPIGDAGSAHRDVHLAFQAESREQVDAFFAAATGAGAEVLHEPRLWPEYHDHYYGAFVRDPDGNNVEAVCHTA
jgi:catechol 2,3-dioxygenase-like lactoylglutathione lyase family enzyme